MPENGNIQDPPTEAAGVRGSTTARLALATAGAAVLVAATGCSFQDRICGSGEYPVKAVGNTTGSTCVPDGAKPPAGYVQYPEGKVPQHVDDKWDKYWSTVVVDENGHIVRK